MAFRIPVLAFVWYFVNTTAMPNRLANTGYICHMEPGIYDSDACAQWRSGNPYASTYDCGSGTLMGYDFSFKANTNPDKINFLSCPDPQGSNKMHKEKINGKCYCREVDEAEVKRQKAAEKAAQDAEKARAKQEKREQQGKSKLVEGSSSSGSSSEKSRGWWSSKKKSIEVAQAALSVNENSCLQFSADPLELDVLNREGASPAAWVTHDFDDTLIPASTLTIIGVHHGEVQEALLSAGNNVRSTIIDSSYLLDSSTIFTACAKQNFGVRSPGTLHGGFIVS